MNVTSKTEIIPVVVGALGIVKSCVGCVVTWVLWVRGLRGSIFTWAAWVNFYMGCMGQIFLRGSNFFLSGSISFTWVQNFLRGSIFFCLSQLLFTRRDYFTILQLIV